VEGKEDDEEEAAKEEEEEADGDKISFSNEAFLRWSNPAPSPLGLGLSLLPRLLAEPKPRLSLVPSSWSFKPEPRLLAEPKPRFSG
jgi:hypothetical protein